MTLAMRLGILVLIGALVAAVAYRSLWSAGQTRAGANQVVENPFVAAPPVGTYTSKSARGSYRLTLDEKKQAKLVFTDRKGKKSSYKGELGDGKIVWQQTLRGKKWVALEAPVDDALEYSESATVVIREGRFELAKK